MHLWKYRAWISAPFSKTFSIYFSIYAIEWGFVVRGKNVFELEIIRNDGDLSAKIESTT